MEKALYVLSINGMQSPNERVACMAINSGLLFAKRSSKLHTSFMNTTNLGKLRLQNLHLSILLLFTTNDVLPVLLSLLTKQNEDPEDDDWSVAMAAGSCLQLFATTTGMYVVEPTLKFFAANIELTEWEKPWSCCDELWIYFRRTRNWSFTIRHSRGH